MGAKQYRGLSSTMQPEVSQKLSQTWSDAIQKDTQDIGEIIAVKLAPIPSKSRNFLSHPALGIIGAKRGKARCFQPERNEDNGDSEARERTMPRQNMRDYPQGERLR